MMKALNIKQTDKTPAVEFDSEQNKFELSGRCLTINPQEFFAEVIEWLEEYVKQPNESTILICNLDYFNSSSARELIELLIKLEDISAAGKQVQVEWHYKKGDELILSKGKEFDKLVDVSFKLVEV